MTKPDPLDKRLHAPHTTGCTIKRFSDRENRRCSCGHDEAIEEAANLRQIKILIEWLNKHRQYQMFSA